MSKMIEAILQDRPGAVCVELKSPGWSWLTKWWVLYPRCEKCGSKRLVAAKVYYPYEKSDRTYRAGDSLVCKECLACVSPAQYDPGMS